MMATRLYTAGDLLRMPEDGFRYELEHGRLLRLVPTGWLHWRVTSRILQMLWKHPSPSGASIEVLSGVFMRVGPRGEAETIKAPDVAVVPIRRIEPDGLDGAVYDAVQNVPLLVVEVHSPGDDLAYTMHKIALYLDLGIPEVWHIDPGQERLERHTRMGFETFYRPARGQSVALPGFVLPLSDLFGDLLECP